jgi:hypothetical protein
VAAPKSLLQHRKLLQQFIRTLALEPLH